MKHVFKAFDATYWDTEAECTKHEFELLGIHAFDHQGDETSLIDEAMYLYVPDKKAFDFVSDMDNGYVVTNTTFCKKGNTPVNWYVYKHAHYEPVDEIFLRIVTEMLHRGDLDDCK